MQGRAYRAACAHPALTSVQPVDGTRWLVDRSILGVVSGRPARKAELSRAAVSRSPLASHRDHAMFSQMVVDCQERIFRLALRITRNQADAEDAQQETLLKAHRKLGQFEGRARFTTWISRIAINESLMSLRKRRTLGLDDVNQLSENETPADHWQSTIEDPESACSRREIGNLLKSAIMNLAPRLRVVFLLRAVEELSTRETASILHISTSSVKARLRRARLGLGQELQTALKTRGRGRADRQITLAGSEKPGIQTRWVA
jgi:RNA polymerase sigma-70 factor (ECF subfamily)